MEIFQSIILGIVQGAGEFLPISSTAHLVLVPYFTGWKDPGLAFDVALHLGTLVALLIFFFWDWVTIIQLVLFQSSKLKVKNENFRSRIENLEKIYNSKILYLIIIATVPGVIVGFLFESKAENIFRNPLVVAFALSFAGLVLYLVDKYARHRKNINEITVFNSIIIGIAQAIAIIPGVSRSGATITAGLFCGLKRTDAARFSFLLSTPIILGAFIFKLPELFSAGINSKVIFGVIFSTLSGYLAIKYLLKFVEKSSYQVFFWYRLGLAILIALFYFLN
jgi:undecaprenyl-diphosphatase